MTTARTADLVVEAVVGPTTRARAADVVVEMVALPTTRARVADLVVEILVGGPTGGWFMDALPMDLL